MSKFTSAEVLKTANAYEQMTGTYIAAMLRAFADLLAEREKNAAPSSGQLVINGQNLNKIAREQLPYYRRTIGLVFQDHQLLFDRSVYDNVALPLQIAGYDPREASRRVRAALDKVGLLRKETQNPLALSAGEQQRVGIARAVVNKPSLLLADEPTGNLDPELAVEVMGLFEQFSQVGVSVLIATHDHHLISRMRHRRLQLEQGRLIAGSPVQSQVKSPVKGTH
jgi:cell division transport system ATP-binding protein